MQIESPKGLGAILAIIVIILAIIMGFVGLLDPKLAALLVMLGFARLC